MNALGFRVADVSPDSELLRGLEPSEIDVILTAARPRQFPAKSVITYQDDPGKRLFLLWKGRARHFYETLNGEKQILMWITPGLIFGGTSLALPPSPYLVSTEAVRDSTVLVWDGPAIRDLARRFPRVMMNAYGIVAMRYLSWYVGAHAALASQTARERLAHVLLGYAYSIGQKVSGGIEVDVTNEELAQAVNITPYTISRLTSEWQRSGAIRKNRGKIVLRSGKRLFLLAK